MYTETSNRHSSAQRQQVAFFVSNLGQVRNAANVSRIMNFQGAHCLVLHTPRDLILKSVISTFAKNQGFIVREVLLPSSPSDFIFYKINKVARVYESLLDSLTSSELWVCNANNHYAYLCKAHVSRGGSINYFEEGLGTYRTKDDNLFRTKTLAACLMMTVQEIRQTIQNPRIGLFRKLKRISHRVINRLGQASPFKYINRILTAGRSEYFEDPCIYFETGVVTFPDAIDRNILSFKNTIRLTHVTSQIDAAIVSQMLSSANTKFLKEESVSLLITQDYGVPPFVWGKAIGQCLQSLGIKELILKNHPRETLLFRRELHNGLISMGINIGSNQLFDQFPVEFLLSTIKVRNLIGITSSALLYASFCSSCNRISIAPLLISTLFHDYSISKNMLENLQGDALIFKRLVRKSEICINVY